MYILLGCFWEGRNCDIWSCGSHLTTIKQKTTDSAERRQTLDLCWAARPSWDNIHPVLTIEKDNKCLYGLGHNYLLLKLSQTGRGRFPLLAAIGCLSLTPRSTTAQKYSLASLGVPCSWRQARTGLGPCPSHAGILLPPSAKGEQLVTCWNSRWVGWNVLSF